MTATEIGARLFDYLSISACFTAPSALPLDRHHFTAVWGSFNTIASTILVHKRLFVVRFSMCFIG